MTPLWFLIKQKALQTVILIAGNHHFKIHIKLIEQNERYNPYDKRAKKCKVP